MHIDNSELFRRVDELEEKFEKLDQQINGENGDFGVALKTNLLWKAAVFIACAGGGSLGVWFTKIVQGAMKP